MFLDMHGLIFHLSISPLAGSTRHLADREASTPKRAPKARPAFSARPWPSRHESSDTQRCVHQRLRTIVFAKSPYKTDQERVHTTNRILFTSQSSVSFTPKRKQQNSGADVRTSRTAPTHSTQYSGPFRSLHRRSSPEWLIFKYGKNRLKASIQWENSLV